MKPCIIVHGGASNIADIFVERYKTGTKSAAKAGYDVLKEGGSALEAVCAAVTSLENNPVFNAGYGSCLTEEGKVEMDALIMDGDTLRIGAVGAINDVANPVQLSKEILERTPHCFMVGDGAIKFAKRIGHPVLDDPTALIVKEDVLQSQLLPNVSYEHNVRAHFNDIIKSKDLRGIEEIASEMARKSGFDPEKGSPNHDTVGAVALDADGKLACATSTGGIPGKWAGRIGDTPLPGCGGYATKIGGASSTGHGESIIKATVCKQAILYMENGDSAQVAAKKAIEYLGNETTGRGGVICISNKGEIGMSFSTYRMGWASINEDGIRYGVDQGETLTESL